MQKHTIDFKFKKQWSKQIIKGVSLVNKDKVRIKNIVG